MIKHPDVCPACRSDQVYYERISPLAASGLGEYVCMDCGWGIDAVTGELTSSPEPDCIKEEE